MNENLNTLNLHNYIISKFNDRNPETWDNPKLWQHCIYMYEHVLVMSYPWYVAGINHEARGHAAPEGRVVYSGNVPNRGRDISNLCHHEPVAMVNGAKFLVLSP